MNFSVHYGKQTFGSFTNSMSVHAVPLVQGTQWKEKGPITACYDKVGRSSSVMADKGNFPDHGKWYYATYDTGDSPAAALCFTLTRRFKGTVRAQCSFHVLPSENGPILNLFANLDDHPDSVMAGQLCCFSGCGFVMDEASLAQMGVSIERGDISHFFDHEELEDEFSINCDGDMTLPKMMQVEQPDGTVSTVIAAQQAKRKLRIRKR